MRPEEESPGPVIRDRRRIDPATGQVRDPGQADPQRGSGQASGQPRPGKHSVSKPGGPGAASGGARVASGPGPWLGSGFPGGATSSAPPANGGGEEPGDADREQADAVAEAAVKLAERTADLQRLQAEYANYRKRVERDRLAVREQALANVLNELVPVLDDIGRAREHGELAGGFKSVAESLEGIAAKLGLTSFGEVGEPFDPTQHEALMHSFSPDVTEPTAVQILQPGYKVGERIIRPARVAVAEPGGDDAEPGGDDAELAEAGQEATVEANTDDDQAEPAAGADDSSTG
jgi:molecular chaperone GrpE